MKPNKPTNPEPPEHPTEEPPPGACWNYLVTGVNSAGEGPMGNDSQGNPRVNGSPCESP